MYVGSENRMNMNERSIFSRLVAVQKKSSHKAVREKNHPSHGRLPRAIASACKSVKLLCSSLVEVRGLISVG